MRSPVARLAAALWLSASIVVPAAAQRVDYDALEQAMDEPVTTSVTGKPQRQSDTPASVVIITRAEIARSPARDVPGLLKSYAGIDVNRWTAGQTDVAVRGGVQTYNPRLLVLVNGRQVYLDHYGMTDWNLLGVQIEEIQQIELVRGPAGALFGFNAASGVVNIITVDPLDHSQVSATAEVGNRGYRRISGGIALPIGAAAGLRVSGGHVREDERDVPNEQLQPLRDDAVARDDVSATLNVDIDPQTRISATGGHAYNRQQELLVTQIISEQRYRTDAAGLRIDRDMPWDSLTGNVYANWLHARYGIGANDPGAMPIAALQTFDLTARTIVAQASGLVLLGSDNTGRVGVEYRANRLDSGVTYSRRINYDVLSANAMLDLNPTDRLNVNLAVRLDDLRLGQSGDILPATADPVSAFDRELRAVSFNAAVQLRTGEHGTIRLHGGRAVQAPSLIVFGMNVPVTFVGVPLPVIVAGDPNIRPVSVWSGELGYRHRVSDAVAFDGALFYTKTNDVIAYPGDTPVLELRTEPYPLVLTRVSNIGDFATYGVELSGSARVADRWHMRANYTLTRTNERLPDNSAAISYSFAPGAATPHHKVNLVVDYGDDRWLGSVVGRYTSATRQIATRPDTFLQFYDVARAFAVDAKIGYKIRPSMMLSLAGENLTNASGASLSPIPSDRRLRAGMAITL